MAAKLGGEEEYHNFMVSIGSEGGKLGRTGGFYVHRELARQVGAIGGRISRKPRKES